MSNRTQCIKGVPYKQYMKEYYQAHKDHSEDRRYKHNQSHSRLYFIWQNMKDRCTNQNNKNYKNYGGRGIEVCDDWLKSFDSFSLWAKETGYKDNLTIDRINVNGNYEPNNCRWLTKREQQSNKTNNVKLTYDNETHNITEWANILGISRNNIYQRIKRGWNVADSLRNEINIRRKEYV